MQGRIYKRREVIVMGATVAAAAGLTLAGCGGTSGGQSDNILTVSCWGVATDTQSIKDAIAKFQKENIRLLKKK